MKTKFIFFLFLMSIVGASGCGEPNSVTIKETRMMMGTIVSIEASDQKQGELKEKINSAFLEMARWEKKFNRFNPESELSRINSAGAGVALSISSEMMSALLRARELGELSEGRFDITVGPLLELWGFFPENGGKIPPEDRLEKIRSVVGWDKLLIDEVNQTVTKTKAGVEIDLAGMVKGMIADRGIASLRQNKINSALINAGGDISCLGEKPGGGPWRIGVEDPRDEGQVLLLLEIDNEALATSGDYRNYFIRHQRRFSHIIDPITGEPADSGVIETSVKAKDCATADGLATALFVLGAKKGMALLEKLPGVEGIIVTWEDGVTNPLLSSGLKTED